MSIDTATTGTRVPSHHLGRDRAGGPASETMAPADATARRRLFILVTCCLALVLTTMDVTIVNIALPAIRSDLHASVAELQWSVDAYTVVIASSLLLAGAIADRFGRRKTFQVGLVTFSFGSLLCSLATSAPVLVAFRVLQAAGGSMLSHVAMSIIVNTFIERRS